MNDFVDFNYLTPLVVYGKSQGINLKVVIVFEHFLNRNKNAFQQHKIEVLNNPILDGVVVECFTIPEFQKSFKSFNGIIASGSGTILRLKKHVYDNRQCRYVIFSYFNNKIDPILHEVDLVFISSAKDLQKVSGLNVRIGIPYWDLYSDLVQYDFQHLSPINVPEAPYTIIIPEIMSYEHWHDDAYQWICNNHQEECFYIFKHRIKDNALRDQNDEFEKKIKKYPNIAHVYDPFFYTTQKLLKNCNEVLFLSNRTLFIYECAKVGIKCRKAFHKTLDFSHHDAALIDKYLEDKNSEIKEIFLAEKHVTEMCFQEITQLASIQEGQNYNKINDIKIEKFENIDFSNLEYFKGKPANRQLFYHLNKKTVWKTWVRKWQWADLPELGIKSNYYDATLVPNFVAFIKDQQGYNRGYITTRVKSDQILENIENLFSLKSWYKWLTKRTTFLKLLRPKYRLNQDLLVRLLYNIFSKSLQAKALFLELNDSNLWTDNKNYFLFDLDALRAFSWLFGTDPEDLEYVRQAMNRSTFNRDLEKLIIKHNLIFPMKINTEKDIVLFWEKFVEINLLTSIPKTLRHQTDENLVADFSDFYVHVPDF